MAEVLPINFPLPSEPQPSFDYFDYATGRGYRSFYATATSSTGPAYQYLLQGNDVIGTLGKRFIVSAGAGYVSADFDMLFNTSAIVEGKCFIFYTMKADATGSVTGNCKFEVFHIRGVTSTSLGSVIGDSWTPGGGDRISRFAAQIDLSRKGLAPGDTFRLTASVQQTAGSNMKLLFEGTTGTEAGTNLTIPQNLNIEVPFVLNI